MFGRTDSRRRLLFLLVLSLVGSSALIARTGYWQLLQGGMLSVKAAAQTTVRVEIPSRRGEIYDRSGTVLLATSVARDRLVATTDKLTPDQRKATGDALVPLLGLDPAGAATLRQRLASGKIYVILARGLEPETADRIVDLQRAKRVFGLSLESEPERVYPQAGGGPNSTLAAQLLGFVNRDGTGQYGIEQAYQANLAGEPRILTAQRDANGRALLDDAHVDKEGESGKDLRLTIDSGLQLSVEQELLAAYIADAAKSVSAVVMDPYTGEVYAEASYPSYDANDYRAVAAKTPGRFVDPMVSSVYEPGSVFKFMTATAALELGTVTTTTKIKDTGTLRLDGGRTKIDDADRKAMGWMTFEDGVAYSRNVIASKVALKLGQTTQASAAILHAMWLRLGYGAKTGMDVAGEVSGLVRDPGIRPWAQIDLANGSFGQGVAITPIQLATAYAALMNGGLQIHPHVVQAVGDRDVPIATGSRLIDAGLSTTLVQMMSHVVHEVPFYRDRTLVPGYYVGGKTGTAQIWDPKANHGRGAWKHNLFNYSFVGYIGRTANHPDLLVALRIEEGTPTVARVGHLEMPVMSFELFRRIATDAITTPDLVPERSSTTLTATDR